MSYNAPIADYAPPPRRRSPWMWTGIGCGSLVALFVILSVVLVAVTANRFKEVAKGTFDAKAAIQAMNGFPQYPGATLLKEMTQTQQAVMDTAARFVGVKKVHVVAYAVPGPSDQVMQWFDDRAGEAGYRLVTATDEQLEKFSQGTQQNQYQKGPDWYLVQVQKNPRVKGDLILTTMRLVNYQAHN